MAGSHTSLLRAVAAILTLACALAIAGGSASASTSHDLSGTWSCCGPGGAASQTWTITAMDQGSGSFSGTGKGGSIEMKITGTASGDAVTLTTDYVGLSYSATFKGTLTADSKSMAGSWESSTGQKGTWTATRPSAPTADPGDTGGDTGGKGKAVAGDIYVSDSSANTGAGAVYKINPENGQSSLVHLGPPFSSIRGVAFGPEGNLFVTDIGAAAIHEINLKTGAVTRITAPFEPLLRVPWGIVYEPGLGDFLVTDAYFGTVVRVDPKTGKVKPLASEGGLRTPHGIALAPGGPAFVTDIKSRAVIRVAQGASGWKASSFEKGPFVTPEGIAILTTPAGQRFFVADTVAPGGTSGATAAGGSGGLFTWPAGGAPKVLVTPTTGGGVLAIPTALAPAADGKTLYIGSTNGLPGTGSIVAMNLADGKLRTLAGGFASPIAIAVAPPKGAAVKVGVGGSGTTASASGVTTTVTSPQQPVAATVAVSVNLPGGGFAARASKAVRVKAVTKAIPPGRRTKVHVPFKPALRKRIKAALRAGQKVKAKVTVTATAASGASRKVVRKVPLAPRR